ncbi:MAG: HK97 family phage prohead protease [Acutalibacteraceae bacterium]|nr:HK97 family phage prohead protease [Acutalibacteraceae bacterium]
METAKKLNGVFEVRTSDESDKAIIYGRPIVYERTADMHYYDEIISRGALDEADLSDICLLVNHESRMIPLARYCSNSANNSLELTVDENGLAFQTELDIENNQRARELYSAIKRGDITHMSFAFTVKEEEWLDIDTEKPTRRINKVKKVYEISAVNRPAYNDTSINARGALEEARNDINRTEQLRKLISII